ncbi:ATP-grasp domain-containing protein [Legionella sp. 28fT52]|uniref:ATP-grasp domain-containing protein n=1 Tax=Legionella sp. 28fT52 TaxID=3410134 RepID=UPI003AF845BE
MNIKLLCIDPLEDYEVIDDHLLLQNGIEVIFASKQKEKGDSSKKYALINSFDYEDLYSLSEIILPDYIVCFSEDLFVSLASIRAKLNIKGMNLSKASLLSHKNLMYEKIDGKFPYPKTTKIAEESDFYLLKEILNAQELFIKPINMAGSYETYHVKNDLEFKQFLANKKEDLSNYIAQTYIDADLYHSELVVYEGEVLFCSARKYSFPNHLMVIKNIPIFSLNIVDQERFKKIRNASVEVIRLLGVNNGIFHTEFFMSHDGAINFIETNARAPGIGLNRLYWNKLSISLETLLCFIVCGKTPPKFNERDDLFICGYYPLKPGVVKALVKPELEVESQWIMFVRPNDVSNDVKHMSKSAMFICWDKSLEKIEQTAHKLANHDVVEIY